MAELSWTLRMDHEWLVRVFPLRNKQPAFGYLMQEAHRWGWAAGWAGIHGFSSELGAFVSLGAAACNIGCEPAYQPALRLPGTPGPTPAAYMPAHSL